MKLFQVCYRVCFTYPCLVIQAYLDPAEIPVIQIPQSTTNCSPPSRIFHGRRLILDKMHQYFTEVSGETHISLLYGLGGTGKTQIGLKFIQESATQ
jgi:hypothetical protein